MKKLPMALIAAAAGACNAAQPAAVQSVLPALIEDAAMRSGVAATRLEVATAQAVTWSDGALGCPQPGRLYTQALVPGWRVVVGVPGAPALHYHLNQRGAWLWCPADRIAPAVPGPADPRI